MSCAVEGLAAAAAVGEIPEGDERRPSGILNEGSTAASL